MTKQKLRIVVADDDLARADQWKSSIAEAIGDQVEVRCEVEPLRPAEFSKAVRALRDRAKLAKAGKPYSADDALVFDSADILVIDNDLTPDPGSRSRDSEDLVEQYLAGQTGAEVARLCRAHTLVSTIVVVNEAYTERVFDLTLKRWATSLADVNVSFDDLDSPALWGGGNDSNFHPSSWPKLMALPGRIEAAEKEWTLDSAVHEVLGLRAEQTDELSAAQLELLSPDAESLAELTLSSVLYSDVYGLGLQPKDKPNSPEIALRASLSGLRRWLDRDVLPDENLFIDLPHLVSNRPWLQLHRNDQQALNAAVGRWYPDEPSCEREAYVANASSLLGRNVWLTSALSEPPVDADIDADDLVFCEDTSTFEPFAEAKSFRSDLGGVSAARYVKRLESVRYTPLGRLFDE